jgi:hypothetical protein
LRWPCVPAISAPSRGHTALQMPWGRTEQREPAAREWSARRCGSMVTEDEGPLAGPRLLPDRLAISFFTDREGNIASLAAPFEPLVKDIVFTRIPAGDCMNPAFRQRCVGRTAMEPRLLLWRRTTMDNSR